MDRTNRKDSEPGELPLAAAAGKMETLLHRAEEDKAALQEQVKDLSLAKRTAEAERAQLQALVKSYEAGSGKLSKCLSRLSSVASTATLPSGDRPPLARSNSSAATLPRRLESSSSAVTLPRRVESPPPLCLKLGPEEFDLTPRPHERREPPVATDDPYRLAGRLQDLLALPGAARQVEPLLRQIVQQDSAAAGQILAVCAPQILQVLQKLGRDAPVVALCFYALARVCWIDEHTRTWLLRATPVDALFMTAVRRHSEDPVVVARACNFLSTVLPHASAFSSHEPTDVFAAVLAALKQHVAEPEAYGYCCRAVCAFFLRGEAPEQKKWVDSFFAQDGLAVTVRGLEVNLQEPLPCYLACQLLVSANQCRAVMPAAAGVVPLLEEARRLHDQERTRKYAAKLLREARSCGCA